jgi:hypothetical protein
MVLPGVPHIVFVRELVNVILVFSKCSWHFVLSLFVYSRLWGWCQRNNEIFSFFHKFDSVLFRNESFYCTNFVLFCFPNQTASFLVRVPRIFRFIHNGLADIRI